MIKRFHVALAIWAIISCLLAGFIIQVYLKSVIPGPHPTPFVSFNQTNTEEAWILTMVEESWHQCLKNRDIKYRLIKHINHNSSSVLEGGDLQSIKGKASGYNITWYDMDSNNFMSISDVVYISKVSGPDGNAESHYHFVLMDEKSGETITDAHLL